MMTTDRLPPPETVLTHYSITPPRSISPAGGTAGRTWRVETDEEAYFLRLRGLRTSTDERIAFDHGLRAHLVESGVPTATAVSSKEGKQWVKVEHSVFELYPFVEGRQFDSASPDELLAAARALARFHAAARDYKSPRPEPIEIAQYAWLGFCDRASDRMDDPELQVANIRAVLDISQTAGERDAASWALRRAQGLCQANAGARYDRLCAWVVHGDYTPANVLFGSDHSVAGIFDFDWAMPGPRVRDVGDALYFFAASRGDLDSSDIWSLTDAAAFDFERCVAFMEAYQSESPLTSDEWDAVPTAFEGRWLSIRLEGMAKVPEAERLRFFGRGNIRVPVEWLDANWQAVRCSAAAI